MLKYSGSKYHDVYSLFSIGSPKKKKNKKMMVGRERERNRDIKQMWQNVK